MPNPNQTLDCRLTRFIWIVIDKTSKQILNWTFLMRFGASRNVFWKLYSDTFTFQTCLRTYDVIMTSVLHTLTNRLFHRDTLCHSFRMIPNMWWLSLINNILFQFFHPYPHYFKPRIERYTKYLEWHSFTTTLSRESK